MGAARHLYSYCCPIWRSNVFLVIGVPIAKYKKMLTDSLNWSILFISQNTVKHAYTEKAFICAFFLCPELRTPMHYLTEDGMGFEVQHMPEYIQQQKSIKNFKKIHTGLGAWVPGKITGCTLNKALMVPGQCTSKYQALNNWCDTVLLTDPLNVLLRHYPKLIDSRGLYGLWQLHVSTMTSKTQATSSQPFTWEMTPTLQ